MKFKKILSLLTAAAMTLSLGITSVSADTTEEAGSVVAKIGGTGYTSLADAFNAAANKATITVVADTSIIGENVILSGKNVTLDLNGKTVTADNSNTGNIQVKNKATLTLKDSAGNGSIVTGEPYVLYKTDKTAIYVENADFVMNGGTISTVCGDPSNEGQFGVGAYQDSNVTINGGTIRSGWYCVTSNGTVTNSNITVNGGELISTADYAIYAPAKNSTVTINNGTVNGAAGAIAMFAGDLIVNGGTLTSDKSGYTGTWGDGTGNLKKAVVSLESGTKEDYGPINARIHGGTITMAAGVEKPLMYINKQYRDLKFTIDGGTFSEDISTTYKDYLDSKATVAKNADNLYEVTVPNAVRMSDIKPYYFPSIQAAVDVIPPTSSTRYIITLQREVDTPTVIKNKKDMVIKLNGHNITASGYNGVFYVENSKVRLTNKTIGDATVGGVVTAVEDQSRTMGIWASTGANVTLQQLTYKQKISNSADDHFDLIYANKDARVYVESGTFVAATPKWTLNKYDTDSATITVTGGKFYQYNPAKSYTEPAPQPTSFVKDGYSVTADGDYFVVTKDYVAQNTTTGTKYEEFDGAIKAAADGATIKLLKDISVETPRITKTITLDLNGHKVSGYSSSSCGVLNAAGGTLTITDSVGGGSVVAKKYNAIAIAVSAYNDAVLNIEGGTFTQEGVTDSDLESSTQYDMIYAYDNAVVNIKGGTFKSVTPKWTLNILDSSKAKFNVTGGKFYNYNPAAAETEPTKPTSFVADGYVATADASGNYTVEKRAEDFGNVAVMTHGGGKLTLFTGINFLDYRNAGFIVGIDGKEIEVKTNKVYEQVTAGDTTFNTANAGAKYIYGAELTLDPSLNGSLKSFTVTPFADVLNKTAERIASSNVTTVTITGATAETTVEE